MSKGPFGELLGHLLSGVVLLLAIALGLRWAYELITPMLPVLMVLVVVGAAAWLVIQRRRY